MAAEGTCLWLVGKLEPPWLSASPPPRVGDTSLGGEEESDASSICSADEADLDAYELGYFGADLEPASGPAEDEVGSWQPMVDELACEYELVEDEAETGLQSEAGGEPLDESPLGPDRPWLLAEVEKLGLQLAWLEMKADDLVESLALKNSEIQGLLDRLPESAPEVQQEAVATMVEPPLRGSTKKGKLAKKKDVALERLENVSPEAPDKVQTTRVGSHLVRSVELEVKLETRKKGKQLEGQGADTAVATTIGKLVGAHGALAVVGEVAKSGRGRFGNIPDLVVKKKGELHAMKKEEDQEHSEAFEAPDRVLTTKKGKHLLEVAKLDVELETKKMGMLVGVQGAVSAEGLKRGRQFGAAAAEASKKKEAGLLRADTAETKMGKQGWQDADSAEVHRRKMMGLLLGERPLVSSKPLELEQKKKAAKVEAEAAKKAFDEAKRLEKEVLMLAGPEALLGFLRSRGDDFGDLGRETVELIKSLMLVK